MHLAFAYAGFQTRHATTWQMLQRVRHRFGPLPDAEVVIDTSDGYCNGTVMEGLSGTILRLGDEGRSSGHSRGALTPE